MLHTSKPADKFIENQCLFKNKQYQAAYMKKLQDQKEMRDMLNKYSPWSTGNEKPRNLRNLRLEGIFPIGDYVKAKRLVSPLRYLSDENRFKQNKNYFKQHLTKNLDSSFCYRPDVKEKEEYKKQLEKQIIERKRKEKSEKENNILFYKNSFLTDSPWGKPGPGGTIWRHPGSIGFNFMKSLGWSTDRLLKNLELERNKYNNNVNERYEDFQNITVQPPNQIIKTINFTSQNVPKHGNNLLSPIKIKRENEGEDLVAVLAKPKKFSIKIPLSSTDVTRGNLKEFSKGTININRLANNAIWLKPPNSTYTSELITQMNLTKNRFKQLKSNNVELESRHFDTLDKFWGRPGHGAPKSSIKKKCLTCILYYNYNHSLCKS